MSEIEQQNEILCFIQKADARLLRAADGLSSIIREKEGGYQRFGDCTCIQTGLYAHDDIPYIGDDSLADKVRMPFQETLLLRTRVACISVACVGVLRVVIFRLVCTIVNHGPPPQRFMIDTYVLSIRQQLCDLHVSRKLPAKGVQRAGGILSTIAVISRGLFMWAMACIDYTVS